MLALCEANMGHLEEGTVFTQKKNKSVVAGGWGRGTKEGTAEQRGLRDRETSPCDAHGGHVAWHMCQNPQEAQHGVSLCVHPGLEFMAVDAYRSIGPNRCAIGGGAQRHASRCLLRSAAELEVV